MRSAVVVNRRRPAGWTWALPLLLVSILSAICSAQSDFQRPVTAAPAAEDIGGDYTVPPVQRAAPRSAWLGALDVVLLVMALGTLAFVMQVHRRRWLVVTVTVICLAYFGFYRQGCVCPIGATQNVAVAMVDPTVTVPVVVLVFFLLPLIAALLFGRVFCGGACPLGAIQDVVLLRSVNLPAAVDRWGGKFRYIYLVTAVVLATGVTGRQDFIICRFDPFVGFFRLHGTPGMLGMGMALLLLGVFVGRPYCRFLCPYGGLLSIVSRFARWPVSITPDEELDCGLCTEACPFGAIHEMRADRRTCLACARCFSHCPRQRYQWGEIELVELDALVASAKESQQAPTEPIG